MFTKKLLPFFILALVYSCKPEEKNQIKPIENTAYLRIFSPVPSNVQYQGLFGIPGSLPENSNIRATIINGAVGLNIDNPPPSNEENFTPDAILPVGVADRTLPGAPIWQRGYSYPSSRDLVPVAPIINGLDFFKWAQITSGEPHRLTFHEIIPLERTATSYEFFSATPYIDTTLNLQSGQFYTGFVLKDRQYTGSAIFRLHVLKDDVGSYVFEDDKMYVRFANFDLQNFEGAYPKELDIYYGIYQDKGDCEPGTDGLIPLSCQTDTLVNDTFLTTLDQTLPTDGATMPFFSFDLSALITEDGKPISKYNEPVIQFKVYPKGTVPSRDLAPLAFVGVVTYRQISPVDEFALRPEWISKVSQNPEQFLIPPATPGNAYLANTISTIILGHNIYSGLVEGDALSRENANKGYVRYEYDRKGSLDEYFK